MKMSLSSASVWMSPNSCSRSSSITSPGSIARIRVKARRPVRMVRSPVNWPVLRRQISSLNAGPARYLGQGSDRGGVSGSVVTIVCVGIRVPSVHDVRRKRGVGGGDTLAGWGLGTLRRASTRRTFLSSSSGRHGFVRNTSQPAFVARSRSLCHPQDVSTIMGTFFVRPSALSWARNIIPNK
jgi:hypothetical protein